MKYCKKIFFFVVAFVSVLTLGFASNYPSDYTYQRLNIGVQGPVLLGIVGSGIMGPDFVIGYKKSGMLGQADKVNVFIRFTAKNGATFDCRQVLTKEWNGTGFLSKNLSYWDLDKELYDFAQKNAYISQVELAFSAGDNWDSQNGKNYIFTMQSLYYQEEDGEYGTPRPAYPVYHFQEKNSPSNVVALSIWNFIVGLMK
ncbi:MAG: hypothetical protein HQM08_11370 [Candidatus Riflebacteria bacterium]|nr:hypothetical protein [Candidatus Riflebacteria bacterium]